MLKKSFLSLQIGFVFFFFFKKKKTYLTPNAKHQNSFSYTVLFSGGLSILYSIFLYIWKGQNICASLREGTFFYWGGLRRGRSLAKFLQIGEGQTCLFVAGGESHFFSPRKKLLHVASIKVDSFIC